MQLIQQLPRVAILPAVTFQRVQALLHAVLEPADGVEVAHLVVQFPQHGARLVKAQKDLGRQRHEKGRQTQADPLFQGHLSVHGVSSSGVGHFSL